MRVWKLATVVYMHNQLGLLGFGVLIDAVTS